MATDPPLLCSSSTPPPPPFPISFPPPPPKPFPPEFFNIKCRASGLKPKCAVIVATVRALKMHGGGPPVSAGKPLAKEYAEEDVPLVTAGCCNLARHIENARKFGVEVVVAVNRFKSDTDAELAAVRDASIAAGAFDAVVANHWAEGGKGAEALGRAVIAACDASDVVNFRYLYDLELPIRAKVEAISREIYGADGVDFSELAEQQMALYESSGFGNLPSEFDSRFYSSVRDINRFLLMSQTSPAV
jgi:formyltetrahydrofolate synthetase